MSDLPPPPPADGWKATVAEFIDARLGLFQIEAQDAGREISRKLALIALVLICALALWALGLIGLIGWISAASGWPWYFVTLGAAVLHALVAGIAVVLLKQSVTLFPFTRSELAKDRAWLQTLKESGKSKH
ncbi:putative membrane protein YqjE [Haloferula luteola]|uniref:Putative membrane protein YqjE n=1 Tax=Haloferula luteola TaxID=595692 RepID=A0A840UZF1_9BACT|nr:phage holin family protein [Haloferula luteola]MBB5351152.1 putative membrane protein YqjE [Haloferula luteola]